MDSITKYAYICGTKAINMTTNTLTAEQVKRINQSIEETESVLNRELSYSADLRNNELINRYENHLKKLNSMLK